MLTVFHHPGYAATNLQFHSQRRLFDLVGALGNRLFAQDERGGAQPTLYAAVHRVSDNGLMGVWKTTNGGTTWSQTGHPEAGIPAASICDQCWYDLNIAVYRINASGSFNLSRWTGKGGTSYTVSANAGVLSSTQPGGSAY